jgi:hypothetical protein
MTRPYTEEQVFDEDTLEAILYDGMIALREAMLEEAE